MKGPHFWAVKLQGGMDPYRRREVKLVIEIVSTAQLGLLGACESGAAGRHLWHGR